MVSKEEETENWNEDTEELTLPYALAQSWVGRMMFAACDDWRNDCELQPAIRMREKLTRDTATPHVAP